MSQQLFKSFKLSVHPELIQNNMFLFIKHYTKFANLGNH